MAGGQFNTGPVSYTASAAVTRGRRVKFGSTAGQVEHAGELECSIGVALKTVALGEECPVLPWKEGATVELVAAGAFAAGAVLYPAAAGKVDDAHTGGGERFVAFEAATADGDEVQCVPIHPSEGASELLAASVADSTTITNTVAETDFDVSKTIKAGALKKGDVLELEAVVLYPSTNGVDTSNVKAKFGGVTLVATGALDVANDDIAKIRAKITIEEIGAAGKIRAQGSVAHGASGTVTEKAFFLASTALDLSADQVLKLSETWSAASAANQAILKQFTVIRHKK